MNSKQLEISKESIVSLYKHYDDYEQIFEIILNNFNSIWKEQVRQMYEWLNS